MGFPLYVERQALFDALAGLGIDLTGAGNVSKIEIDSLKITLTVFPRGPHGGILAIDDPLKIEIAITGQANKINTELPLVAETERPGFSAQQVSNAFDKGTTAGARKALAKTREMLDGWIEGAKSNHAGMAHRGESEPCWATFGVDEIKAMVKDVERELGLNKD